MIQCDNPSRTGVWFHFVCVGINNIQKESGTVTTVNHSSFYLTCLLYFSKNGFIVYFLVTTNLQT